MGTSCTVAVTAEPRGAPDARRALAAARVEVAACERALSRFDASSDLSRLNRAAGSWVDVDARLIEALEAAVRGRIDTWGLFDPSILPVLEAAGYDRSFEQLVERDARSVEGWRADARIDVDPEAGRARIARRAAVDLGGLGKGFAATRAVRAMRAESPALVGALVDLGGDIAVCGVPPEDGPWRIDVDDPRSPGSVLGVLELTDGGVATSGRNTRRFGPGRKLPSPDRPDLGHARGGGAARRDGRGSERHGSRDLRNLARDRRGGPRAGAARVATGRVGTARTDGRCARRGGPPAHRSESSGSHGSSSTPNQDGSHGNEELQPRADNAARRDARDRRRRTRRLRRRRRR